MNATLVAVGCGRLLAEFCLHGINFSSLNAWEAFLTAAYAVDQVKKFDPRCGGKFQLGACWSRVPGGTYALITDQELTAMLSEEAASVSNQVNERWNAQLADMFERLRPKLEKEVEKEFKNSSPSP